jgi:signal transduction histidine kinase
MYANAVLEDLVLETQTPGVEQTDLSSLVRHREWVDADCHLDELYQCFQTHGQDYCAVQQQGRVVGLCSKGHTGFLMGHRYGFAIYSHHPVRDHLLEHPLFIRHGTPVREVLQKALSRQGREFNDDAVLLGSTGEYMGIIPVPALVRLQSALVDEKFRMQEALHRRLLAFSRQAGMAEVATGVLHNVGNVLNSAGVSATLAADNVRESRISSLDKTVALLHEHHADLGEFLTNDPKGRLLPEYLSQLAARLKSEQAKQIKELDSLVKHITHIKNIVAMQQSYAKVSGLLELVSPAELVHDALELNAEAFTRQGIEIVRHFEDAPKVIVDKHKVLQILINLLRNGKYALEAAGGRHKRLVVGLGKSGKKRVRIIIQDNGVGIAPENLERIFGHGFTTRKDGHGFGLHNSALAAREMGGSLCAHSDGLGKGATFVLELPVEQARAN